MFKKRPSFADWPVSRPQWFVLASYLICIRPTFDFLQSSAGQVAFDITYYSLMNYANNFQYCCQ